MVSLTMPDYILNKILSKVYYFNRPLSGVDRAAQRGGDSVLSLRKVANFNVVYRPGSTDEKVLGHSFGNDIFYSRMYEYSPGPRDIIIDIGAHIGTFSLLSASKAPGVTVHAVEACYDTCNLLRMNAAINPALDVRVHHAAISDRSGECQLHHAKGNWGHSITKDFSQSSEVVPAWTLEELLSSLSIGRCSLLKFNCEGAEFPIIMSSSDNTLLKISTYLVLYHNDLWDRHSNKHLVERFSGLGYNVRTLESRKERGWIIAVKECAAGPSHSSLK